MVEIEDKTHILFKAYFLAIFLENCLYSQLNSLQMREEYIRWYSPNIGKELEILVFGEAKGYPVVLFPTTMGRYYECKDFLLVESARWFVEQGLVQIICPDSINDRSWYAKDLHPAQKMRRAWPP